MSSPYGRQSFWARSPSPIGRSPGLTSTPKRRPKDEVILPRNVQRKLDVGDEKSFEIFQEKVKNSPIGIARTKTDSSVAAKAIAKYGLNSLLVAIAASKHVPTNFLNRDLYVFRIIQEVCPEMTEDGAEELLRIATDIDSDLLSSSSEEFQKVLWKTSYTYNEPYLNFICPQNSECLNENCDGKVYPCYKSEVTIFKLSGPEPGMKCSLRCRSCKARYHINFYSIPKEGKKYYPAEFKPTLKSCSSRTFFTRDTYELMCESG